MEQHFRARNTVIDMLKDRGYKTKSGSSDLDKLRLTMDEFKILYDDNTSASADAEATPAKAYDIAGLVDNTDNDVYVLFLKGRMGTGTAQDLFYEYMKPAIDYFTGADDISGAKSGAKNFIIELSTRGHIIVVYTPPRDKKTSLEKPSGFEKIYRNIEFFHVSRLGYNITKYRHMGPTPHPISAQPQFSLYRQGTPEWINVISIYGGGSAGATSAGATSAGAGAAGAGAAGAGAAGAGAAMIKKARSEMNRYTKVDRITRWYGASADDIFRIVRGGRRVAYRIVY